MAKSMAERQAASRAKRRQNGLTEVILTVPASCDLSVLHQLAEVMRKHPGLVPSMVRHPVDQRNLSIVKLLKANVWPVPAAKRARKASSSSEVV